MITRTITMKSWTIGMPKRMRPGRRLSTRIRCMTLISVPIAGHPIASAIKASSALSQCRLDRFQQRRRHAKVSGRRILGGLCVPPERESTNFGRTLASGGRKSFGEGSHAPVAIVFLIKNPASAEHGKIYFHAVDDYLTREEKLACLRKDRSMAYTQTNVIVPDAHGDWLNHER